MMSNEDAELGVESEVAGWLTMAKISFLTPGFRQGSGIAGESPAATQPAIQRPFLVPLLDYCAAFTSFQTSLYLARRGTFCQK